MPTIALVVICLMFIFSFADAAAESGDYLRAGKHSFALKRQKEKGYVKA